MFTLFLCAYLGSSKAQQQERKATPTPREMGSTKSPLAVGEHTANLAYERILHGLGTDMYRGQIPLTFDAAALPRGIPIDSGIVHICRLTGHVSVQISMINSYSWIF